MSLTPAEASLLRKMRDTRCLAPNCPCRDWAQGLADHLRRELPDVDDVTLARLTVIASQHARGWAACNADGLQVATVLCAAASELASLHLD